MHRSFAMRFSVVMAGVVAFALAACGGDGTTATSAETSTTIAMPKAQNPIRIVFDGEISGPLVYDCALVKKGVHTALRMLGNQVAGWPIEYQEVDNRSDPLLAVEQTRALVEMDRNGDKKSDPVDFICGPLSSSAVAGVTFFLAQRKAARERIPQCSVSAQPSENITTSGKVGFIPNGIYSSHGYYLGKFAAEILQYKTANCIHYSDRIAEELQAGFERGFREGGGTVQSVTYVPADTVDFSTYFAALQPADCTMFWVRGSGAIPFVQQHAATGLSGALLVPMASNYSESQLEYLEALGLGSGIVACDIYTPMIEGAKNRDFIAAFQQLYPGEYPTPEVFGGWQAVMLYAEAVKLVAQRHDAKVLRAGSEKDVVDPRNPVDVIAAMATLNMDTPAGPITMTPYASKRTYVATRDFYILRSKDVGGGRIAWAPIQTYSQVRLGE
jgi:ABC-type branched-subunit amino acid transport system substrate-binding protein